MSDESSSSSTNASNDATIQLSPDPPLAPNWNDNLEKTILSLAPYQLFPIAPNTLEYETIASLLDPITINSVEQIVNPMLWSRFTNTRKQMLLSKTDDFKLLPRLSLDHTKIFHQMHIAASFQRTANVAAYPYNDNLALLFHCTRTMENANTILVQGLDERLGAPGLMGKGIYFASDPLKSMNYDGCGGVMFIFMVLLGDSLSVTNHEVRQAQQFVREPLKHRTQQRNFSDVNFDSIVGRPGAGGACEYVIYNRYQCCPLYKISYQHNTAAGLVNGNYSQSKNDLPPFLWTPPTNGAVANPPSAYSSDWPLFAKNIFSQMGVQQIEDVDVDMTPPVKVEESDESINNKMEVLASLGFSDTEHNLDVLKKYSYDLDAAINDLLEESADTGLDESEILVNNKLATLTSMGFTDAELNERILKKNSYDLNKCICELMELDNEQWTMDDDSQTPPIANGAGPTRIPKSKLKDCEICDDAINESSSKWKRLRCGHELCNQCYKQIETTRTTMGGIQHTFTKCPLCGQTSGIEVGTCPDGQMTVSIMETPCAGYEKYQTIRIQYSVQCSGCQLNRTAFLPDNDEGNELLRLLRIAWDRRICFNIGKSATTGDENVLTWNIRHKTAQNYGVTSDGFPDATFMQRCKSELGSFGIC